MGRKTKATARHDHARCIGDALNAAAAICARRGARLTELRRRVLELVWQGHEAVKAYDLIERLGPGTKPPTVYRALDFLVAHGLVHRLESLNAYVGCPHPGERHDGQFLICEACGNVDEFDIPELNERLSARAAAAGFVPAHRTVELRGLCDACRGRDATP
jgi:Fur family zinc uptake transcriptional regulator